MKLLAAVVLLVAAACGKAGADAPAARSGRAASPPPLPAARMTGRVLVNRFAYIPPQCYTATQLSRGKAANPCFVCHTRALAPNYVDDSELQQVMDLPPLAAENPWSNLFSPAIERAPAIEDAALLDYVRTSNYLGPDGALILPARLADLPAEWDADGDRRWDGFVPDAYFDFDERGFDRRPDGTLTGWRAYAYYPLPGSFFPSNGSMGDALIRLDPALREDAAGHESVRVTELNLAIVEALITRRDVAIEASDEAEHGVDLDLDGKIAKATRVAFGASMHYVGRAHTLEVAGKFPIAAGLFPLGTELLHTLRYLDIAADRRVVMAARMKELRYARKARWLNDADLKAHADAEAVEQQESATGALQISWQHDRGVYNNQGWLLQAFIEASDGNLRPQSYEETAYCVGCHGGIGATTDSTFSFARKLTSPAAGYFHWTQHDLHAIPEPRRADGSYEYTHYLQQNHAGDELRANEEILQRFFDSRGSLRTDPVRQLHDDISTLLMPSPARALALDRAYRAIVVEQSFEHGRDAILAPANHVQHRVEPMAKTGITQPVSTTAVILLPQEAGCRSQRRKHCAQGAAALGSRR